MPQRRLSRLVARYIPPAMPTERQQRQIERLLDQMEEAAATDDWGTARTREPVALHEVL